MFLKNIFLTATISILFFFSSNSQELYQRKFGGSNDEVYPRIITANNGGHIVFMQTKSGSSGEYDLGLVKLYANGKIEWSKRYGSSTRNVCRDIINIPNGYFTVGWISQGGMVDDMHFMKLDNNGNIINQKTWGLNLDEEVYSATVLNTDNIAITGSSHSYTILGSPEIVYSVLDSNLNMGSVSVYSTSGNDIARCILEGISSDLYIAGYIQTGNQYEGFLMRINSNGNIVWATKNSVTRNSKYWDIIQSASGDIYCVGEIESPTGNNKDILVSRYDSSGTLLLSHSLLIDNNYDRIAYQIKPSHNGNYVICATSEEIGSSNSDIIFMETNDLANTSIANIFGGDFDEGWPHFDYNTTSEGYLLACNTNSYNSSGSDISLIRINNNTNSCCSGNTPSNGGSAFDLYPVPINFSVGTTTFNLQSATVNVQSSTYNEELICYTPVHIIGDDTLSCVQSTYAKYTIDINEITDFDWIVSPPATIVNNINDTTVYINFNGQDATIYLLSGNCSDTLDSLNVTISGIVPINLGPDSLYCNIPSITLHAGNTYSSYLWQDGSTDSTLTVYNDGTYWVHVTDAGGCTGGDTINISFFRNTVDLGNDTTLCSGDPLTLDAGPGFSFYSWNTGQTSQNISVNTSGTYDVLATYAHCSSFDDIVVDFIPAAFAYAGSDEAICKNEIFDFNTCAVLPNASNYGSLLWIGGTGFFSNPNILKPVYYPGADETGNITLSLIAYSTGGCPNDTASMTLTINELPIAEFVIPTSPLCSQNNILFQDNSSTAITSWLWDFGDGSSSTAGPGTNHTYSNPGTYAVNLSVINSNGCTDDTTSNVIVNELPTVDFAFNPNNSICVNQNIDFTDLTTGTISGHNWNFGDGTTSTVQNPSHSYSLAGNFNTNLIATNNFGCVDSLSQIVEINPLPEPQITILPGNTICAKTMANFSANDLAGTNVTNWNWDFGDGQITTGETPSHFYSIPGDYIVTLSAINNNNCEATTTTTIHVNSLPQSSFVISPNDTSCVGEQVSFEATDISGDIDTWQWEFGDTQISTGQSTTHTWQQQGNMNVLSIYTNTNGCTDTTTQIRYAMDVNVGISADYSPYSCQNYEVTFTGTGNRVTFTPWNWQFGDGVTATGTDVTHTYTTPDTVDIILDVCSQQATQQIIINATCEVYTGPLVRTCQDVYYDFTDGVDPPTATNYTTVHWYTNGVGYFDNPAQIAPTYFPDPSEGVIQNDTLTMMMVGYGLLPCENDTSYTQLVVIPGAYAFAGSDEYICDGQYFDISTSADSAFATHYAYINWSTSGTGTFNDPTLLRPIYFPGSGELGEVTLTMVAANIINCDSIDEMTLTIHPTYEMPTDITVCHYDSAFLEGAWRYDSGTFYDTLPTVNYGCDSVLVTNFIVRPKIDISYSISTGDSLCFGETCLFDTIGSANLVSWNWNFGDGNTSTQITPSHTYSNPGNYISVFSYTDINGCYDSTVHNIQVFALPDVSYTTSMSNACVNSEISFTGLSNSTIIDWQWDFGDGATGSGQTIAHTYTTWGNMYAALTVTDINGCSNTYTQLIIIAEPPVADFTYAPFICDSIQFTDLSTCSPGYDLVTWYWDFGDGTTDTLQNPTHQFPSNSIPGGETFMVTLVVTSDSLLFQCTDSITLPVTVPSIPDIFVTFDPEPACLGDSINFFGESGFPIETWHWNFDDGNFSNDQYATHLYANSGNYNVILNIVDTNGCVNSLADVVVVNPVPEVSFTMSDSVICKGSPVYFTATGSSNIETWYWEFGDGGISYEQNPVHYFPQGNTYTITLLATDSTGCSGTFTDEVLVSPGPTADFSYLNQSCTAVAFIDESTIPTGYLATEFFWDFGDGFTSTLQNPVHSYNTGISTYDVMFIVTADSSTYSCSDTTYQTIYTPGLPSVFFTWNPEPTMLGDATDFFGTSGNTITDWYWDFGDGQFSTDQEPSHVFLAVGTYTVELTVTDIEGCENSVIHDVTVTNVPDLDFEWSYTCINEPIQFTILDPPTDIGGVATWYWDFGNGGYSTEQDPIHTYLAASTYNVSCTIVDTMGATNTVMHQIIVNPLPTSLFSIDPNTCTNNPVQFYDHSSTTTGYITQWYWDFGDGTDTTVLFNDNPDVTHIYTTLSTFTATLTVTNSDSCTHTSTQEVTTIPGPTAMFDHESGCASGPVSFTDTSIENGGGEIVTWAWDFGDPTSGTSNFSTQQNPTHMFTAAGDYTVSLHISNVNGCTDTTSATVTVGEQPGVEFTWAANCLGEETQFTVDATITNIPEVATWDWDFGDGATSNLQDPTHIYTIAGTFDVTLTIETNDGCFASVTNSVDINPLPTANFDHTGPSCLNNAVEFTNLSSSPNGTIQTWIWDFGDGNEVTINAPDNPNVSHTYDNENTFAVTLTVTDDEGCENSVVKNVEVVSNPIAEFNFEETCFGDPVIFTDISSTNSGPDIGEWEWYFGDPASGVNNNSSLQNPTHIYVSPGTYITTLIIHNTLGCSDTTEQEITVDSLPNVDFTIANDTICLGELAEFTGISTSEINSWFWQFGDGGTSIEQNPSYGYANSGAYTVTLTVTEIGGCENSISKDVFVNEAPEALFTFENVCLGDSTYFTSECYSPNGYIVDWNWDFGDGNTSTQEDPAHEYLSNDTYVVTLIITDNFGCGDTVSLPVQVFDVPRPAFTFDQVCDPQGQVNYFNESEPGGDNSPIDTWEWNLDDGYYSSEIDPSYIYNITDTCYTVTLTTTDLNGCSATDTNTQVCLHGVLETSFEATTVCLGQYTEFVATYGPESDSVASYTWDFHDGSDQQITYHDTISHIFPAPGVYVVELIALDTNDCEAIFTQEITIDSLPTAQFTNTLGNCDIPTQFYGVEYSGGEFIQSWQWDFGDITSLDNTSTLQNPTHQYGPYDSIYQVKLIVTNFNGCVDSVVQDVYVEPCLTAGFQLPLEPVCARNEICFTDTSSLASNNGTVNQWRWDFGDGTTYNYGIHEDSICHEYEDAGTYDVQLIIVADLVSGTYNDTIIEQLTVHATPMAYIAVSNTCMNDTTYFADTTNIFGEPTTHRLWNFGDLTTLADTANAQDTMYVYPTFETYDVSLWVQNQYMCEDSTTTPVTIYKLPEAQFTYQNTCMSYFTQFEETSVADSADIAAWFWSFGDTLKMPGDTANISQPQYVYDSADNYNVTMIVTDEHLCKDTVTDIVDIFPIPTSEFVMIDTVQQGQVYFDNLSDSTSIEWEWDFDYNQSLWISDEKSPIYQYEEDGNYTIMLVSWNEQGCPDTTYQMYDLLFTNLFVPNAFVPSSPIEELQIFKPKGINLKSYKLEVYSTWGNLVFESTKLVDGAPAEGWDGTYEDKELPTGSYIWRISAVFEDNTHWKGTDNGDGNTGTSGTIMLVR